MKFKDALNNKKLAVPYFIAVGVIVFFALIFGLIFGFNKGYDFTGGTRITVDFASDMLQSDASDPSTNFEAKATNYINNATKKVKEIITKNGGKIHSIQVQNTNDGKSLIVTIRQKNEFTSKQIRIAINEEFNTYEEFLNLSTDNKGEILDGAFDLTKNTIVTEGIILQHTTLTCIAAILTALVAIAIYCFFRFKFAGGAMVIVGGLLNLIAFCGLMILSRIEINAYFYALLAVVTLVSVYNSLQFLFDIKEKLKDPKFDSKTNEELSSIVLNENLVRNITIYACCLGIAVIMGLFGVVSILHLGIATILALFVLFTTHTFVLPEVWVFLNQKNNLVRPVPKAKKSEVEQVSQKNNKDDSAETIEVEEEKEEAEDDDDVTIEVIEDDETSNKE